MPLSNAVFNAVVNSFSHDDALHLCMTMIVWNAVSRHNADQPFGSSDLWRLCDREEANFAVSVTRLALFRNPNVLHGQIEFGSDGFAFLKREGEPVVDVESILIHEPKADDLIFGKRGCSCLCATAIVKSRDAVLAALIDRNDDVDEDDDSE